MPKVSFSYADRRLAYPFKKQLKDFILQIVAAEAKELKKITYIFCSDDYLLQINQQFLQHDFYTDIITFDLSETEAIIGEVYISLDRVKENAASLGNAFSEELTRVVFHGILHLCGYKDKKKSEIQQMRHLETHYIRLYQQTILDK